MSEDKKVVVTFNHIPSIIIGDRFTDGFTVDYCDKKYVLFNSNSEALLQFSKRDFSTRELKQKLLEILKSERTVDQTLAAGVQVAAEEKEEANQKRGNESNCHRLPSFFHNNVLYEECFDGEDVFFAAYNVDTKVVSNLPSVQLGIRTTQETFIPIRNRDVYRKLVHLPSKTEEYGDLQTLINDIITFLDYWHEPVSAKDRLLDAYYVLLPWFKDLVPQLPYRRMLAPYGSGKSSWLDAVGSICYRGLITTGASTVVSLIRTLDLWRGTAIIDEADFSSTEAHAFMIKILTVGYDSKTGYYRKAADADSKDVVDAYVYGPKLLATRHRYEDMALESRCLTTQGRENRTPKPPFRMHKFEEDAQTLRNKLLKWRFDNYCEIKEKSALMENPNISATVYGEGQHISRRIQQVILPLSLFGGEEHKKRLRELAEFSYTTLTSLDDDYLLQQQTRDAVLRLIRNNELEESENYYELNLTKLSYMLLSSETTDTDCYRNPNSTTFQKGDVESMSKKLKRVLETNLAFELKIKRKVRYFRVPKFWCEMTEEDKVEFKAEDDKVKAEKAKVAAAIAGEAENGQVRLT